MKGDTSSGQEPISTLNPVSILMFAHNSFQIKSSDGKLNMDYQLQEIKGICSEVNLACFFLSEEAEAFLLEPLAPLCPLSNREI